MTTRPLPSAGLPAAGARQAASVGPTRTQRATAAQDPARERPIQGEVVDDSGFSWADAGIGALAAVGVVLVAAGAWVALRGAPHPRRRNQHARANEGGPHAH